MRERPEFAKVVTPTVQAEAQPIHDLLGSCLIGIHVLLTPGLRFIKTLLPLGYHFVVFSQGDDFRKIYLSASCTFSPPPLKKTHFSHLAVPELQISCTPNSKFHVLPDLHLRSGSCCRRCHWAAAASGTGPSGGCRRPRSPRACSGQAERPSGRGAVPGAELVWLWVKHRVTPRPKTEPWQVATWTKTCGPLVV